MKTGKFSSFTVKRIIFVVCAVFFSVLQHTFLPTLGFSLPVYWVIPLCVGIAMAEGEFTGALIGLFTGALWDISAPLTDGVLTLYFTVFACAAGLVTKYLFRNTLLSALVLTGSGTVVFTVINFIFNCLIRDIHSMNIQLIIFYLTGIVLTVLLTPLFYFPFKALNEKFNDRSASKL